MVGAEPHLPYERPALSKDHLLKGTPLAEFTTFDAPWYDAHDVTLRLGVSAVVLDLAGHRVALSDGEELGYTRLALATGSRPRQPDLDGAGAEGVHLLRTIEDSDALDAAFREGARTAIVGGGWIGLEAAAAARSRGAEVTVLEAGEQPLGRVLGNTIGAAFADLHRRNGVDLRTGVEVAQVTATGGRATGVQLADGEHVPAGTVVFGIGAQPNIELAAEAGLAVDAGVIVDAGLRTSDPDVVAVGDIAEHDHPILGRRVRVEHWDTARNQPEVAARTLLGGDAHYDRQPFFFTDQFDLGMEYRGLAPRPDDVVVRGPLDGACLAFWLDEDDRVAAAMNVNIWDVGDDLDSLVGDSDRVDRARLADPQVPLADVRR
ncbi:NAD(P)/FAD-dependent oxidoreductase [Nocardioides alcanivorans]|uniref:NAD(P)/FAD-dependent oxidoreductase n=1 Tax=Nocardioides alcanivorans TaxID=2897352 RepID=UPI001F3B5660|nr:FAD-dependent oxidoreductase [Nocardioides alcanivorans]